MAFPATSGTSNPIALSDFKNLVFNFLENNESSFSTNLDVLIRIAEDFIWGVVGGYRTRFKSSESGSFTLGDVNLDIKSDPPTSGNIKDLLSVDVSGAILFPGTGLEAISWVPLQLRDYDFVTQSFNLSNDPSVIGYAQGRPRYYAIDPLLSSSDSDENQDTIRIIVSPRPGSAGIRYRYSYTKFPLSLVDVTEGEGTWISRNYPSALLYGVLYHGYLYEKGEAQLMAEYKKLMQESLVLVASSVLSNDVSEYEKGTSIDTGAGEIA